ncbi:phage protein Gp27 family protein [Novosphingobium sp. KACC 22771]|uniref:phage protein Gp27 family protein n=1 Tax=Novosphingobium sp. KACC 22771 TaxID=3025670 RepID=UPI0023654F19|nr:phage protein Gp27 family protein [Novosphingobium sp. KACC 22771]WDF73509.1 DUF3486 family protein [Novosphingobium sp. KACC 22771]
MARKSSLAALPPQVQGAVLKALESGATIDAIVERLGDLGHPRSRSAVGRYAKSYQELAKRQADIRVVAEAFGKDFGGAENAEGKLMVQMLTSIGARMILPMAAEDDPDLDSKQFLELARGTKELINAAKLDADRDEKVRDLAKREAAEAAEKTLRKTGATAETINKVKAEILGLAT